MRAIPEGIDPERLVVVTTTFGEKFVGHIPPYWLVEANQTLELSNVRSLVSRIQITDRNSSSGVTSMSFVVPIDLASTALPKLWVIPSSWYFPKDTPDILDKILSLLDLCIKNEVRFKAKDAGIVLQ